MTTNVRSDWFNSEFGSYRPANHAASLTGLHGVRIAIHTTSTHYQTITFQHVLRFFIRTRDCKTVHPEQCGLEA
jgi:hypothetical protein